MATSSFNIGDLNSDIAALNSKINVQLITTATDLNNLLTDNYRVIKHYTGDNCSILTNCPNSTNIPWELEVGCLGTNINYQYQEFRLYQNGNQAGSKIFRRQKYYYGVNDFRWNNWVCIDDKLAGMRILSDANNNTSFSFNVKSDTRYRMGLVMYKTGNTSATGYLGILFIDANNVASMIQIYKASSEIAVNVAYANETLTFTSASKLWGGIRVIFLD